MGTANGTLLPHMARLAREMNPFGMGAAQHLALAVTTRQRPGIGAARMGILAPGRSMPLDEVPPNGLPEHTGKGL